ncbi:hypothetical protein SLS54_009778 [Diplodia seriata]
MPYLSPEHPEISPKDILSWGFDDAEYDQDKPLWIDASDPSRSISANQTRTIIKQLVAGFRKAGLKPGDTVCITSFSDHALANAHTSSPFPHLSSLPDWHPHIRRLSFLPPFHAAIAPSLHIGVLRSGDTTNSSRFAAFRSHRQKWRVYY